MKVRSLLFSMLCMLALGAGLASCSDDDDDDPQGGQGSKVELPRDRVFILNQGSWGANNAGLAFYAPNGEIDYIKDIFRLQNEKGLGDNAQDLIEYDDRLYVSVNTSNCLYMLDANGVELGYRSFAEDADLSAGIRYLAAEDGYLYASFYNGFVAKFDANTLELKAKLGGLGDNLEGLAIEDDLLYVANSYRQGSDGSFSYNKSLTVVDLRTFQKTGEIEVALNPNRVLEEEDRLFVLSLGDYGATAPSLQMIEPKSQNKITHLGAPQVMCAANEVVYWLDADRLLHKYHIQTGKTTTVSLASEWTTASVMMMAVNEANGDIYITTSDYTSNGTVYRFSSSGSLIGHFDSEGINPFAMVFID